MLFCEINEKKDSADEWDNFVLSSPLGHIFQTYDWGELSKELGWGCSRYLVKDGNKILAAAQVLKRTKGLCSILYIPRGPVFSGRDGFFSLVDNLKKIIHSERAVCLKINPAIEQPSEIERWYCQKGFLPADFRDMHICTFRIDLTDDLAKVWENFRGSVRTAVRKAEKSGVCVQGSEDNAALEKFYTVYSALAKAGRLRIHSYKFISDVYERLYRKGQVRIFNAIYKDRPIATEFLFLYSKKAEQMWAASLKLDNDLGASQLIHWRIVKWLKDNGFQVYDLGGVPPDKTELPGISFYKQSLGGKYVELLNEQELPGNPLLYFLWRKFGKFYINRKKS